MHEHNQCEHKLKYCKICDTVYCEKCKKEWHSFLIHYGTGATTTASWPPTNQCHSTGG